MTSGTNPGLPTAGTYPTPKVLGWKCGCVSRVKFTKIFKEMHSFRLIYFPYEVICTDFYANIHSLSVWAHQVFFASWDDTK